MIVINWVLSILVIFIISICVGFYPHEGDYVALYELRDSKIKLMIELGIFKEVYTLS